MDDVIKASTLAVSEQLEGLLSAQNKFDVGAVIGAITSSGIDPSLSGPLAALQTPVEVIASDSLP